MIYAKTSLTQNSEIMLHSSDTGDNTDLLESLENKGLCISAAGFMDNVNILTYGLNTRRNYEVLKRIHLVCETWVRRHRSKFNLQKYNLIYFIRRPQRFNIDAGLTIKG